MNKFKKAANENWAVQESQLRAAWRYAGPIIEHVDMTEDEAIEWLVDKIANGKDGSKAGYMLRKKLIDKERKT